MKMPLFHEFNQKIAQADWSKNPELGLLDTLLEKHPELLGHVKSDITKGLKESNFGRKDMPSVEQVARAAPLQGNQGHGLPGTGICPIGFKDMWALHKTGPIAALLFSDVPNLHCKNKGGKPAGFNGGNKQDCN